MITNIIDENITKIIALFLISPGSRYIRKEIKEKTEMNNIPLDKTLNQLLSLGIIKKEKNLLSLNLENNFKDILYKIRKEFIELDLPLKVYLIVLAISNKLSQFSEIKSVYLFGSYAKLIYHENSDMDIAITFNNSVKSRLKLEKRINSFTEKISKKNKKEIHVHFFLDRDMKVKDPLIKDILRNGKRLI